MVVLVLVILALTLFSHGFSSNSGISNPSSGLLVCQIELVLRGCDTQGLKSLAARLPLEAHCQILSRLYIPLLLLNLFITIVLFTSLLLRTLHSCASCYSHGVSTSLFIRPASPTIDSVNSSPRLNISCCCRFPSLPKRQSREGNLEIET